MKPVNLSYDSFKTVPVDGSSGALSDGDAYFPCIFSVEIPVDVEMRSSGSFSLSDDFTKFPIGLKPLSAAKTRTFGIPKIVRAQDYFFPLTVTERRFRPLALLRDKTALPPGVAIRLRNPCVRLRLKLCG